MHAIWRQRHFRRSLDIGAPFNALGDGDIHAIKAGINDEMRLKKYGVRRSTKESKKGGRKYWTTAGKKDIFVVATRDKNKSKVLIYL